ncbi:MULTISPECIES: nucleotidyltransferase domain-containing protein [Tissierellales]|jgi:predicted nucleotidyltransferase|uniref:Nucleotidyltransferase domain-containing protein n=1 Tax=Acidilutibacter cellobiosedens TaxID=2507161 RepID=A0A410QBA5_9FIRM|nr:MULTISPECIES: nucleotidyltransferase domain-containing protein [Tissierellales]MBE6082489.1 nucleotidyltransferase domain-containing protein [Tissierellaceae bacterium]QAT61148.1 nucleotidyltransferase domain-containing protein [Acidilutibacter cellobiosedens]SCL93824.1 putative nucleotidyltransferases [Sporanaerobacter sp. PP17-6a]
MASFNNRRRVEEIIVDYGKLIEKEIDVKYIYLYGSCAKGTYTEDSDIDIAIVGDDFGRDIIEDTLLLMKLRRKIDYRLEPRPFRTIDFNPSNPLAREIMNTGIQVV